MNANAKSATARLSKNQKYLIVEANGQSTILNANLIRYLFDIPYTRKNGTQVSIDDIYKMKLDAQAAYDKKAREAVG